MRRSEREILDIEQINSFILKEKILRVAFYDNGEIYIVPVNYGFSLENGQYTFYFHGAKDGRKYDLSKGSPYVGFEIDGNFNIIEGETACHYSAAYKSVIGTGKIHIVENLEEKIKALDLIMSQSTGKQHWDYKEEMVKSVAVFKINVEKLSCKSH